MRFLLAAVQSHAKEAHEIVAMMEDLQADGCRTEQAWHLIGKSTQSRWYGSEETSKGQ